jgi:hypothetical protein
LADRFKVRLRRAARDEIRHARTMRAEARRHGAAPAGIEVRRPAPRTLFELAVENAREGCVAETFAALVAHVQAARCSSPRAGRQFAQIAEDETRHAELAWDLHLAMRGELGDDDRSRLDGALLGFLDDLAVCPRLEACTVAPAELGMPGIELDRELRRRLAVELRMRALRVSAQSGRA